MPFYDLRCTDCETESNIMATMADKTAGQIPCPECGSLKMETVYNSAPAYIKSTGDSMPSCANSSSSCAAKGCRFAS